MKSETKAVSIALGTVLMLAWVITSSGALVPSTGTQYATISEKGPGVQTSTILVSSTAVPNSNVIRITEVTLASMDDDASQFSVVNLFPLPKYTAFMQGRRNRLEIYAEILKRLLADPLGITEIALYCKLNFSSAKEMVDFLVSKGLIATIAIEDDPRYATTRKGLLVLRDIEKVSELFRVKSSDCVS